MSTRIRGNTFYKDYTLTQEAQEDLLYWFTAAVIIIIAAFSFEPQFGVFFVLDGVALVGSRCSSIFDFSEDFAKKCIYAICVQDP
jgi:hypothetical protein